MTTTRERAWALFDAIVDSAPLRDANPWQRNDDGSLRFEPDYDTLRQLLGVPALLQASSQSGVPALALDVWVSYELRRAGFDPSKVWPRPVAPRVLPQEVLAFVQALPAKQRADLLQRISVKGTGGSAVGQLESVLK